MKCVVFLPGILGSELEDPSGDRVWPPSLLEFVFGYDRIAELMADGLRPVAPIRNVSVYSIYRSILDDIERCGYIEGGIDRCFLPYPYDWRRSNVESAQGLADQLDQLDTPDEILLLAHSMGGLVSRYLLESGDFTDRSWFPKISALITLGTPHFGAPKALTQLLGREKVLGIRGRDLIKLASDSRYPSAYQLVPAPETALTVPRVPRGRVPTRIDSFASEIAGELQLNPANIQAARDFWAALDLKKRPDGVDYFFFGGAAHKTTVRNEWDDPDLEPIERKQAGDGTVPIASAVAPELAHGFSMKKHTKIFEDRNLRRALYRFLDAPQGVVPQAAELAVEVGRVEAFGISVDKDTYLVGEPIEIVASYNQEVRSPSESFQILALDPADGEPLVDAPSHDLEVSFEGVEMTSFSVVVTPDLGPGLYELKPSREVDDPERTLFMVVADA